MAWVVLRDQEAEGKASSMQDKKSLVSRRAFLGIQALAVMSAFTGCANAEGTATPSAPRSLDEIISSGFVSIGVCSDNEPLCHIGPSGNYDGLDQSFASYLAAEIGVSTNYVCVDPRERYDALLSGAIDVCISQMSPSDARSSEVAFVAPLYVLQLGVVSATEDSFSSIEQLDGGELIVCEGSYAQEFARTTWPDVPLRTYSTLSETYEALEAGYGKALISDEVCAAAWLKDRDDFVIGMRALGEPRLIAPAAAPTQEELLNKTQSAVAGFITLGYRARAYAEEVRPAIGSDAFATMFDGV